MTSNRNMLAKAVTARADRRPADVMSDDARNAFQSTKPGEFFETRFYPPPYGVSETMDYIFGAPTQFFARSYTHALEIAKARGLGEEVMSVADSEPPLMLPSEWYEAGNIPQAMHAACWMGYVALKSGTVSPEDLLSDGGVIHNLAHLSLPARDFDNQAGALKRVQDNMLRWLRAVEAKVPGYTRYVPLDIGEAFPDAKSA